MKKLVKSHLKNCAYFKNKKGEDKVTQMLNNTDTNNESDVQTQDDFSNTEQERKGPLDRHVVCKLSKTKKLKLEQLILKMIVSNSWSFRWVDNPDSQATFKFFN
ncbi:1741_t:CDS:2 [Dentiscutata erythropus]|uniref:1741_t:CDS:1 n=1 Tax=Dentiscutata erythropus TaxID=1348616 RepID=A0A9N9NKW7_9GLOM|nr:1741_t:CDS:2 [Dentiscutata erythropus]